jgi:hypothetical protein
MANEGHFVWSIGGIIDNGLLCDGTRASMMKSYLSNGMDIFIYDVQVNILM